MFLKRSIVPLKYVACSLAVASQLLFGCATQNLSPKVDDSTIKVEEYLSFQRDSNEKRKEAEINSAVQLEERAQEIGDFDFLTKTLEKYSGDSVPIIIHKRKKHGDISEKVESFRSIESSLKGRIQSYVPFKIKDIDLKKAEIYLIDPREGRTGEKLIMTTDRDGKMHFQLTIPRAGVPDNFAEFIQGGNGYIFEGIIQPANYIGSNFVPYVSNLPFLLIPGK